MPQLEVEFLNLSLSLYASVRGRVSRLMYESVCLRGRVSQFEFESVCLS